MKSYGSAYDAELWEGETFREDGTGRIVWHGEATSYLLKELSREYEGGLGDQRLWRSWHDIVANPALEPRPVRPDPSRPGIVQRAIVLPPATDLTVKVDGVVLIQGSEEIGIGVKLDGDWLIPGGEASLTVKVDGA